MVENFIWMAIVSLEIFVNPISNEDLSNFINILFLLILIFVITFLFIISDMFKRYILL